MIIHKNFRFYEDYYTDDDCVDDETVFTSLFDSLNKSSQFVAKNLIELYKMYQVFLNEEYFVEYDTLSKPKTLEKCELKKVRTLQEYSSLDSDLIIQLSADVRKTNEENKSSRDLAHVMNLRLELFLKLFSNLDNLNNLRNDPNFYENLLIFLRKPHAKIQQFSLECLLKFNNEEIMKYAVNLRKFINKQTYKEQITTFDVDLIDDNSRKVPVISQYFHLIFQFLLRK